MNSDIFYPIKQYLEYWEVYSFVKISRLLILLLCLYPLIIKGQDGCKKRKPINLDKQPFLTKNKLICDRFYHAIDAKPTKLGKLQLETSMALRDEFYKTENFDKSLTSTFNVYASYRIKYTVVENFELNLIINELILFSGDEIEVYGGENPYSRYALGTKYELYRSDNYKNVLGLWGQLSFSNKQAQYNFYPEMRILYFRELVPSINFTTNIGGALIAEESISLTYGIELKMLLTKKLEVIFENYINSAHLNTIGKPSNRLLLGFGNYVRENFYIYLTFEKGIEKFDYLNNGKIDLGLAYRFWIFLLIYNCETI